MPKTTNLRFRIPKTTVRCAICNGCFGLIRHRFAYKQFCSKQCLDYYLANRKQQLPASFKEWMEFSRTSESTFVLPSRRS